VRLEPGTTKNDEARVFPFTEELRAVLEDQRVKTEILRRRGIICPWVFHRDGKPIKEFPAFPGKPLARRLEFPAKSLMISAGLR
jgi:hypothetical protein